MAFLSKINRLEMVLLLFLLRKQSDLTNRNLTRMTTAPKEFKDLFLLHDITIFKLLKLLLNKLQIFEQIC